MCVFRALSFVLLLYFCFRCTFDLASPRAAVCVCVCVCVCVRVCVSPGVLLPHELLFALILSFIPSLCSFFYVLIYLYSGLCSLFFPRLLSSPLFSSALLSSSFFSSLLLSRDSDSEQRIGL